MNNLLTTNSYKQQKQVINSQVKINYALSTNSNLDIRPSADNSMSIFAAHHPIQNRLLAVLPSEELNRILPHLEYVPMPFGKVLNEPNGRLQYVYFPTTSIVSLLYTLADGGSSEIGVIGNEGVLGVSVLMGGETTPNRAIVRSGGFGYRLKAQVLNEEFSRGGVLMHYLLRYTQALMVQVTQTAVCNRHHSIEQQLCRCILLSHDRVETDSFPMTQELISSLLGVRREGVTEAACKLKKAEFIYYSRGVIQVLDRSGLESQVCECYSVVKNEYDRLIPKTPQSRTSHLQTVYSAN